MFKFTFPSISLPRLLAGANLLLVVIYIGLIAIVMSYAALHVEFAEEVKSDEATVAKLEAAYFAAVSAITKVDYLSAGYRKPIVKTFVTGGSALTAR
ncbi:hypothetical protein A3H77_00545 [Candidatus Kaiserbacteria bacterium RIFCSPLOWO2_02_FULL_56_11]|uniref:Uncharacterized protein n=2 Tax=Candidatus Kaiseribacteriota TaxID=1752734 RepID=A0A1F6E431_9BACT|nr:MAG: hypothetical protein A3C95_01960 [Candidatus Kaiserbacteria bacterium RIFCSPHIGHO2_02_FULL_56_30]OGG72228.1 MAG: hypothetical protein A3E65_00660 [Candidatus Kaiserbacteria bacterium RIFCSPHIGHO2_12_FULL_56_13]OGG81196.1 MAG: hypothetical protein A3H77_00545 [Candidatus Kaiserbacteria bacterium RIFCSPLOWO2_02_FULL_56_11]